MEGLEYRYAAPVVLATVGGMAAPYETWQTIGQFDVDRARNPRARRKREKVSRGAFADSLGKVEEGKREIKAFMAHQPERILGRTGNGSLKLHDTQDGLRFEISMPDTMDARDALALIERGDISASIGFLGRGSKIARGVDDTDGTEWQVLQDVDLYEISLTANPAYRGTVVSIRNAVIDTVTPFEWGWIEGTVS